MGKNKHKNSILEAKRGIDIVVQFFYCLKADTSIRKNEKSCQEARIVLPLVEKVLLITKRKCKRKEIHE